MTFKNALLFIKPFPESSIEPVIEDGAPPAAKRLATAARKLSPLSGREDFEFAIDFSCVDILASNYATDSTSF
jgi:hypothetical protein